MLIRRDFQDISSDTINTKAEMPSVTELSSLTELYLDHNQITDISALKGLSSLTYLDLTGNPLTDYSPIEDLHIEKIKTS